MTKLWNDSNSIIHGDLNFLLPSHMNYGKVFLDRILKFNNKVAVINGATDEQITFLELAQKIVNTASSLTRQGLEIGDVVAICSENRIEFLITAIAVICSGAVLTFLNSSYAKTELIHMANISKPKYVFLSPDAYKMHFTALKNLRIIKKFYVYSKIEIENTTALSFEDLAKEIVDVNSFNPAHFYGREHTALIFYSSGTTGLPKGVKISHRNYISTSFQEPATPRPLTMLTVAPWCNIMGFLSNTDALINGKTCVFLSKFVKEMYLSTIEKYKVGLLLLAPPTILTLCKSSIADRYDTSSVEILHSEGAPLAMEIINEAKKKFPSLLYVLQGYGMTETTGVITKETESAYKKCSVGKAVAGCIIKIVDIESQKILGPGQPGELCVKGTVVFDGYIGKSLEEDLDQQGFFKTGDIGYYDEDEYFFIVDRLKELIKYKAWQVSPSELEAILLQHPAVKDAAVVGAPDPEAGELPTAFIVKKSESALAENELIDFVATKVSSWKLLRGGVRFVEEIPKNGSGKILRRILRDSLIKPPTSKL